MIFLSIQKIAFVYGHYYCDLRINAVLFCKMDFISFDAVFSFSSHNTNIDLNAKIINMSVKTSTQWLISALLIISSIGCSSEPRVAVLMYHEITDNKTPGDQTRISLARFEEQMAWLAANDYKSLTLDEFTAFIQGADSVEKSLVLTFDDGWKSQLQILPILKRHGFKATFFVFPGEGIEDLYGDYLSWKELQTISADPDFEVQAHSMTHPWAKDSNLVTWIEGTTPGKNRTDSEYELKQSRHVLEERLGEPVRYFAWPAGYFNEELIQIATATGYQALFTILEGASRPGDNLLKIPRFFINGSCGLAGFQQSLREHREVSCEDHQVLQ